MRTLPFASILFAASRAFCQSAQPEPEPLRALLAEVHQLRVDLQAMTVASSRVQIALQSLQLQDAAVARAAQRLDEVRNKCAAADAVSQRISADLQRVEQESPTVGPEIGPAQGRRGELRTDLGIQASAIQACKAAEAEAASQLRNDQAKMTELQDRISRLDRTLEQLGTATK